MNEIPLTQPPEVEVDDLRREGLLDRAKALLDRTD